MQKAFDSFPSFESEGLGLTRLIEHKIDTYLSKIDICAILFFYITVVLKASIHNFSLIYTNVSTICVITYKRRT